MTIFDLFSKRQKKLRGEVPDVYAYDDIPKALRVQVAHIWRDSLGSAEQFRDRYSGQSIRNAYQFIVDTLCREYGVFELGGDTYAGDSHYSQLTGFLLTEKSTEKVLDAIELALRFIDRCTRDTSYMGKSSASKAADEAIEEFNERFREHGVGYQYSDGEIIRVDSEFIHSEAVKPALILLRETGYEGAQAEFLRAHEQYRHANYKESLAECLKAFESVMKVLCAKRKWKFDPKATSKGLLETLFENELIPRFWEHHFSALRGVLESGIPTARNRLAGHGQGSEVINVPPHLAAYVLHQTAAAILFVCEAGKASNR